MGGDFQQPTRWTVRWPSTRSARRNSLRGEGRCPVVPLVFKTSLGAVRSSEGSTPSLLRQIVASRVRGVLSKAELVISHERTLPNFSLGAWSD